MKLPNLFGFFFNLFSSDSRRRNDGYSPGTPDSPTDIPVLGVAPPARNEQLGNSAAAAFARQQSDPTIDPAPGGAIGGDQPDPDGRTYGGFPTTPPTYGGFPATPPTYGGFPGGTDDPNGRTYGGFPPATPPTYGGFPTGETPDGRTYGGFPGPGSPTYGGFPSDPGYGGFPENPTYGGFPDKPTPTSYDGFPDTPTTHGYPIGSIYSSGTDKPQLPDGMVVSDAAPANNNQAGGWAADTTPPPDPASAVLATPDRVNTDPVNIQDGKDGRSTS